MPLTYRRGHGPWKMAKTRQIASLGNLRLHEDSLVSNTGFRMSLPRLSLEDFSVVVPLLDNGRLVFVWNHRPGIRAWELELPAGHLDGAEDPLTCAKRELEEEVGYSARQWERLGWFHTSPAISPQRAFVYLAKKLKKGRAHREPYETMGTRILSIKEAYRLLWSGKLYHSSTIAALGIAEKQLRRTD